MFGRRSNENPAETAEDAVTKEGGKGRATPKRSEAEKLRRNQLVTAPRDRKEAYKRVRERQAQQRVKAREGMAKGDSKFLPKRDQGPVRKLARDYVDSRRTAGQYLMFIMLIVVAASFVRIPILALATLLIPPVLLAVVLTESLIIARKVKKLAAERYPDEDLKGVGLYAATRSLQLRRLRIPTPVMHMGQKDRV
ncbi:DUF3043 domain-containing protein [Actinocorallia longicatena]|uniref:DUF3043 domain-containing protein n=1 Tax=Actinocorallia longicatena TaxID=111803 RepID=UPI0031DEB58C